ncbi:MAG: SGNH/GDSL hydrolase family protein [Mycobacteriales bacterium]
MRIGSGVLATAVTGIAVIGAEVVLAMRKTYLMGDSAPPVTGEFGKPEDPLVRLVMIGDSTAAGVGVSRTQDTIGAQVAMRLSSMGYHVKLSGVAISGSRAGDLAPQVGRALVMTEVPDIALIIIGGNDATHFTQLDDVGRSVEESVRRLREAGIGVVVATCPEMGAPNFARPLRDIVSWRGRGVAAKTERAATRAGGLTVDLAREAGPIFKRDPQRLHSVDDFHPSAAGYRVWADAIIPVLQRAVAVRQLERG